MVATLLFDIGNVIVHFDFGPARARLAQASSVAGDPLEIVAALKDRLEIGEIDGPTFVDAAIERLGYRHGRDAFRRTWESIFSPNQPMWETIAGARERYRLVLISNTSDIHKESLFRDYPIFESFDGGVYSYASRHMKPAPEAYRIAVDELGLRPAQTLYVDDGAANVEAGRREGFVSVLYDPRQHDRFLAEARVLGVDL